MRKSKEKNGLYHYLESHGVLDSDDATIKAFKRLYYKEYRNTWRKNKRRAHKKVELLLSEHQHRIFKRQALAHKRSMSEFIKEAVSCYLNKRYLVPDVITVNYIKELLTLNYCQLKQIISEHPIKSDVQKVLLSTITRLEENIIEYLTKPKEIL